MRRTRGHLRHALLALSVGAWAFAGPASAQSPIGPEFLPPNLPSLPELPLAPPGGTPFPGQSPATAARPSPPSGPIAPTTPRSGEHVLRLNAPHMELSIVELQSRVIESPNRIKLVEDFNPATVSVEALNPTQIRVRAEAPGVTSIRVTDEFGGVHQVEVFVERDLRELQSNIGRLFPGSAVKVVGVRDSIILQGWVSQPDQIPAIVDLATLYGTVQNHIQVAGGNLVQINVKVLEVQRTKMEKLGFDFTAIGQDFEIATTLGATADSQIAFSIIGSDTLFDGFIEALKDERLIKILASPKVATISGRPATMNSGGEFPVPIGGGVGVPPTVQWRQYGISVESLPIVLGKGRVRLEVAAEVSERDFNNVIDVGGFAQFGLSTRNVNTGVEMNFGETLMIGGLISSRLTVNTNKIPYLGDIPYLGAAFSRKNHEMAETEIVILVTPHLVSPMSAGQVPTNGPGMNSDGPTTHELFFNGHVEVPLFGPDCPDCPAGAPGLIGPGIIGPSGMPTGGPAMGTESLQYFPGDPGPQPTPASSTPAPPSPRGMPMTDEARPGGVEAASWNSQRQPGRATNAAYSTLAPDTNQRSQANRPSNNVRQPSQSPGLISPEQGYVRPTPKFLGSTPTSR